MTIFSATGIYMYHGDNKLHLMIRFTLYKTNTLSCICIVLAHWNNSPWTDMSLHSDTLSWFQANQSLVLLLCASQRSSNYQFDRLCFDPSRNWTHMIYCTQGEHANGNDHLCSGAPKFTPLLISWVLIAQLYSIL